MDGIAMAYTCYSIYAVMRKNWLYFTHLPRRSRGQICTKFGFRVDVADIITCNNFLANLWGAENQRFLLTKPVAVNTVLLLAHN